ncbi:hypothetical protein [Psychrobacter sp. KH172YL61]|uniref:hypothetical protein n=1 Tax=Psychrobacter sp. KH172YL61 TaxID=2517899 RepID=UPI001F07B6F8|nr:hypothetical protein [Psychrobacter sp. KH172YL61]
MSNSTVSSINTLLNKTLMTLHLASNGEMVGEVKDNGVQKKRLSVKEKMLSYNPMAHCQPHTLHYAMKGLGYLPTPVLEGLIGYLKGPHSKQYQHANAHLRLILAVNSHLKTPLELTPMHELRERFAADAVAMQAPSVWHQAGGSMLSNIKPFIKKGETPVNWEDKTIANADDGDMTIRCYQAGTKSIGAKKDVLITLTKQSCCFFMVVVFVSVMSIHITSSVTQSVSRLVGLWSVWIIAWLLSVLHLQR